MKFRITADLAGFKEMIIDADEDIVSEIVDVLAKCYPVGIDWEATTVPESAAEKLLKL